MSTVHVLSTINWLDNANLTIHFSIITVKENVQERELTINKYNRTRSRSIASVSFCTIKVWSMLSIYIYTKNAILNKSCCKQRGTYAVITISTLQAWPKVWTQVKWLIWTISSGSTLQCILLLILLCFSTEFFAEFFQDLSNTMNSSTI